MFNGICPSLYGDQQTVWDVMAPNPPENQQVHSVGATPEMVAYCFDVLVGKLTNQHVTIPASIPHSKFPLFVTWKKGNDKRLRGCIGTFSNLNLQNGLHDYALTSAFEDSRFEPIQINEVTQLHCGVSLLINFEDASDYLDWEVGKHGIRIHFYVNGRENTAVFLPEVAPECGWGHIETVDNLIKKSGYRGKIDEQLRRSLRVVRFQSSKSNLSYQDYITYRNGPK
ncbi:unnamed protein product, partial [Mesorhabditis belari]|uniref:AMMECR1 domain-containing protein n=1 Tax=Mesorhabditis belari TaxID=2138241 RepID=A0AAF3ENV9_9BILA